MQLGVGLFVRDDLTFSIRDDLSISNNDFEALWVDLEASDLNFLCVAWFPYSHKQGRKRVVNVVELDCKPISTPVTTRLRAYGNQAIQTSYSKFG